MTRDEIRSVLSQTLIKSSDIPIPPNSAEWLALEHYFEFKFPNEFVDFYEMVDEYRSIGDLLRVACEGNLRGANTIVSEYESESTQTELGWPKPLIPFYSIGNGDFYCLNSHNSNVVFVYHEDRSLEVLFNSFGEWIRDLPNFV